MRIIAQKSNTLNTEDFFYNSLTKEYIDAITFNVTYTKDNKIVVFNSNAAGIAITNTINDSTLGQLQDYEIILLDEVLKNLNNQTIKKDLYINLTPLNTGILSDENIQQVTERMYRYINELKRIINQYPSLTINLHSISRNLVSILQKQIQNKKIGFAVTGNDLTFIDVNYYVLVSNTQNETIINTLLQHNKEVIIYVTSNYYISYLYEHYFGENTTPELQQTFQQLAIITNYPTIIHKVFQT